MFMKTLFVDRVLNVVAGHVTTELDLDIDSVSSCINETRIPPDS